MNDVWWMGLTLIASMIVVVMLIKMFFKEKNPQMARSVPREENRYAPSIVEKPKEIQKDLKNDIVVMHVITKPGLHFASYDLFQAISAAKLQFGEMNIFHYYDEQNKPLFSLASATEPGDFDLNAMGEYSCVGLSLFMNLRETKQKEKVFGLMLDTALQLADDLNGELRESVGKPWNDQVLLEYHKKIREYALIS
jgi:cell division protein ZipA